MDVSGLVLGVDVGNSKTHVAVADRAGRLVASAAGAGVGGLPADPGRQLDALLAMVDRTVGSHVGFASAAFAMAGLDLAFEEQRMAALVRDAGVSARAEVCNDTFALLRTGSESGDGIAVVAGAGINCVGSRGDRTARFHSFGRLSGDWGGGQDVGEEGLAAACRAEDGRGAGTVLAERIPEHFGVDRPLQVTEAVQLGRMPRGRLVELAPIVFRAALDGDAASVGIVHRLADEVVLFVDAVRRRIGDGWERPTVLLGGGLLQSRNAVLVGRITAAPNLGSDQVVFASVAPVVGALLLAFDRLPDRNPAIDELAAGWSRAG